MTDDKRLSENINYRKHTVEDLFKNSKSPVKICAPMIRYSNARLFMVNWKRPNHPLVCLKMLQQCFKNLTAHKIYNVLPTSSGRLPFRSLVREYGCDLAFTPMIVADGFVKSAKARDNEFTTNDDDSPLIVQFAANNGTDLANAAELVALHCDGIDLNCGCPQRWAMADHYGAHLISDPSLVQDMVRQTKNRITNPKFSVSLKIRIHEDIRQTVEFCRQAEKAGVTFLTVHGRTVKQRTEPVSMDAIREICKSLSMPVVANGDIRCLEDVDKVHQATGVAGVMAARGLLQNPALFAGFSTTPPECIGRWLGIALDTGISFTSLHHHLVYMTSGQMSRGDRRWFTSLSSVSSVLDFLDESYDIKPITRTTKKC